MNTFKTKARVEKVWTCSWVPLGVVCCCLINHFRYRNWARQVRAMSNRHRKPVWLIANTGLSLPRQRRRGGCCSCRWLFDTIRQSQTNLMPALISDVSTSPVPCAYVSMSLSFSLPVTLCACHCVWYILEQSLWLFFPLSETLSYRGNAIPHIIRQFRSIDCIHTLLTYSDCHISVLYATWIQSAIHNIIPTTKQLCLKSVTFSLRLRRFVARNLCCLVPAVDQTNDMQL